MPFGCPKAEAEWTMTGSPKLRKGDLKMKRPFGGDEKNNLEVDLKYSQNKTEIRM